MDCIKRVYEKRVQAGIYSHEAFEKEDKMDTIQAQDVLMLDKISI